MPTALRVAGRDLRVGDTWICWKIGKERGIRVFTAFDPPYRVPAKIMIASVAEQHPEGLPGRTGYWISRSTGKSVGCTLFDDDLFDIEREEAP